MLITDIQSGNTFFVNSSLDQKNVSRVNSYMDSLPLPNNLPVLNPAVKQIYGCIDRAGDPIWVRVYFVIQLY